MGQIRNSYQVIQQLTNQQNQQLTTEDKCDQKLKPNSEENCPIEQNLLKLMPEFNLNLCPPSTTTKDLLILNEMIFHYYLRLPVITPSD